MATATYTAGTWLGIVRTNTVVLLGPGTPPALVQAVWELLADAPEVHEVLHAVTSSFGVSLAQIPSFGIVDFRDGLRVFLRGNLDLAVQLPGGPVDMNGRDVTTWTERRLDTPDWYRLTVAGAGQSGPGLPLGDGVVLLESLTVALTGAPGVDVAPEPERAPEVSADTVMGVMDDDSNYAVEAPEPGPDDEPQPDMAPRPDVAPQPNVAPAHHPDQVPAHELTGSYDHLWEKTVVRSIEDAAVRDEPDAADDAAELHTATAPETAPPTPPAPTPPPTPPAPPALQPAAARAPSPDGLIDSVPWRTGGSTAPAVQAPPSFNLPTAPAPALALGAAPAAEPGPEPVPEPAPAGVEGDHDGHTIMKSDLAGVAAHPAPMPAPDTAAGPVVLARVCGRGHANPPTHAQCAACGSPLPADAVQVARPRLGRMRVSTGELVDLDQSLVIGRQPSVSRVQGGVMPRLVQVASPSGDISRSHVEVRLEGWHVMLCDLKATNGTVLIRGGQPPRRLAQNEMAILLDGDIAELGDDVSLRFEEIL
ncbi:MAG TPA: FHA domain-containing protein [Arthrobacter sp.]|nr:FHA domain-containing protein [Arthrobacter sp.]